MSKPLLLVFDDEKRAKNKYLSKLKSVKTLEKNYRIEAMGNEEFLKMVNELRARKKTLREDHTINEDWGSKFDEASIFLIDYDLIDIKMISADGEDIAYYLRNFSKCDFIIGLNRFGVDVFDLTLNGHIYSFADLNIGFHDLTNSGLWSENSSGYRPWHWPSIIDYHKAFANRVQDVKDNLKKSIAEVLQLPKDFLYSLPQTANEHLGVPMKSISKITFEDFFHSSNIIFKQKDKKYNKYFTDEMVSRIVASRLSKWLERDILPGQNFLIDAPHLVLRYPSLLKGDPKLLKTWNYTSNIVSLNKLGMNLTKIKNFLFKKNYWLSRPTWFWNEISECKDIPEVNSPWKKVETKFVFAEDASRFYKLKDCREFISEVNSPYRRRYVKYFSKIDYRPKIRLFME